MNEELKNYIHENVEDFELRAEIASNLMFRLRCSLNFADHTLYDDMYDCAEEYCDDNGLDINDYDMEDYL